jgi:hypothetical protein
MELSERILRKTDLVDETFCWLWRGAKLKKGYGIMHVRGKVRQVHRVAYAVFRDGKEIEAKKVHYTCLNKNCANPWHMKPVTRAEHVEAHGGRLYQSERERKKAQKARYRARLREKRALLPVQPVDNSPEAVKRREAKRRYKERHSEKWLAARRDTKSPCQSTPRAPEIPRFLRRPRLVLPGFSGPFTLN